MSILSDDRYAGIEHLMNPLDSNYSVEAFHDALIMKGFSNKEEILTQSHLESVLEKGEVLNEIQKGDIGEGKPFVGLITIADYNKLGDEIDAEIKKGQENLLTEEEFEALEKASKDYQRLQKSVIDLGSGIKRVAYLLPTQEATGEDVAE